MNLPYKLSIVIPLHNEAAAFPLLLQALRRALADWTEAWQIVAIDDGSRDATWQAILTASREFTDGVADFKGLRFSRNFGKEAAMLAGLEAAQGEWVVVMDGDGQHPPALLPEMLRRAAEEGVDLVAAQKRERATDGLSARLLARLFNRFMHLATGLDLSNACDYRLMKRHVVDALLAMPERTRFFRAMTAWTGFRQANVPFDVPPRLAGATAWTTGGLIRLAVTAITGFSAKPLTLIFRIGLLGLVVSIVLALQALWSWLSGVAVSGWTSLTLVIVFFGSANLLGIGVMGAYLAQLFDEIKARPVYLVSSRVETQAHDRRRATGGAQEIPK